ncbi:MAG TPA: hypothetical protein DCP98_04830 [Sphaerochaeta sp.]|nr:hypothetical protein [Sphaerochaeta sp.]
MKYGYCTGFSTNPHFQLGLDLLDMIKDTGFDYVEFPLMNFHDMTEQQFDEVVKTVKDHGLTSPVACNFFPGSVRLVGKELDRELIASYLDVVVPRLEKIGITKVILGSGPARTFGPDQTREEAFEQFSSVIREIILPRTKNAGIVVCIEPFERTYCNLIISVYEGLELVKAIDDEGLELMVDLYHMLSNGEPLKTIRDCFAHIRHVHVAGADRRVPDKRDGYVFEALEELAKCGYEGTVSFESELPESREALVETFAKVRTCIGDKA